MGKTEPIPAGIGQRLSQTPDKSSVQLVGEWRGEYMEINNHVGSRLHSPVKSMQTYCSSNWKPPTTILIFFSQRCQISTPLGSNRINQYKLPTFKVFRLTLVHSIYPSGLNLFEVNSSRSLFCLGQVLSVLVNDPWPEKLSVKSYLLFISADKRTWTFFLSRPHQFWPLATVLWKQMHSFDLWIRHSAGAAAHNPSAGE